MTDPLELDFWLEPDSHVYTLRGGVVPACTQALELARPDLSGIPEKVLRKATDRGKDVHRGVELHCKSDYDARTGSREVRARMRQWEWFVAEYRVRMLPVPVDRIKDPLVRAQFDRTRLLVEVPLVHPVFLFGVTPDVGYCEVLGDVSLVEVKATSAHNRATALQTASQQRTINYLFEGIMPPVKRRYGVRLTGAGRPDVRLYDDETDWSVFMSFLNVHNWRRVNL